MPTTMEGLTQLGSDLRDAIASVLGLRGDMQTLKDSSSNSLQTIINNYQNRAPAGGAWIDANNGVDAPGRGGDRTPYKSIDYALDRLDLSVPNTIYLLSDAIITRFRPFYDQLNFVGYAIIPSGPYGFPYTGTNRKLSWAPEAFNSPRTDFGRVPPFLDMQSGSLTFNSIDIMLPALPAGVLNAGFPHLVAVNGRQISLYGGSINAEAPSGCAKLFSPSSWQTFVFFNSVTIGANARGQIFAGVAANTDPNAVIQWRSNLTAA